EHRLVSATPDAAGPDGTRQHAVYAVLGQHELLGDHLGFGVEVGEPFGVGHRFVAAGDGPAAHHHTVRRGIDEALDSGLLPRVHQVLGAVDVDPIAALPILLGHRSAAHQLDDRRGVEDGVDAFDSLGADGGVGDVTLQHFQVGMVR